MGVAVSAAAPVAPPPRVELVERFSVDPRALQEGRDGCWIKRLPDVVVGATTYPRFHVRCIGQHCGIVNRNRRLYPAESTWGVHTRPESIFAQRVASRRVTGQLEHPPDGRSAMPLGAICVTKVEPPRVDDGRVYIEFETMSTEPGLVVAHYIMDSVGFGVSSRGSGSVVRNHEGIDVVQPDFEPSSFDCVCDESTPGAEVAATAVRLREAQVALLEAAGGDASRAAQIAVERTAAAVARDADADRTGVETVKSEGWEAEPVRVRRQPGGVEVYGTHIAMGPAIKALRDVGIEFERDAGPSGSLLSLWVRKADVTTVRKALYLGHVAVDQRSSESVGEDAPPGTAVAAMPPLGPSEYLLGLPDGSGHYRAYLNGSQQWDVWFHIHNLPPERIGQALPTLRDAKAAAENHRRLIVGEAAGPKKVNPMREQYDVKGVAPYTGTMVELSFGEEPEAKTAAGALEKAGFHVEQTGEYVCVHTAYADGEQACAHICRVLSGKDIEVREDRMVCAAVRKGKVVWSEAVDAMPGDMDGPTGSFPEDHDEPDGDEGPTLLFQFYGPGGEPYGDEDDMGGFDGDDDDMGGFDDGDDFDDLDLDVEYGEGDDRDLPAPDVVPSAADPSAMRAARTQADKDVQDDAEGGGPAAGAGRSGYGDPPGLPAGMDTPGTGEAPNEADIDVVSRGGGDRYPMEVAWVVRGGGSGRKVVRSAGEYQQLIDKLDDKYGIEVVDVRTRPAGFTALGGRGESVKPVAEARDVNESRKVARSEAVDPAIRVLLREARAALSDFERRQEVAPQDSGMLTYAIGKLERARAIVHARGHGVSESGYGTPTELDDPEDLDLDLDWVHEPKIDLNYESAMGRARRHAAAAKHYEMAARRLRSEETMKKAQAHQPATTVAPAGIPEGAAYSTTMKRPLVDGKRPDGKVVLWFDAKDTFMEAREFDGKGALVRGVRPRARVVEQEKEDDEEDKEKGKEKEGEKEKKEEARKAKVAAQARVVARRLAETPVRPPAAPAQPAQPAQPAPAPADSGKAKALQAEVARLEAENDKLRVLVDEMAEAQRAAAVAARVRDVVTANPELARIRERLERCRTAADVTTEARAFVRDWRTVNGPVAEATKPQAPAPQPAPVDAATRLRSGEVPDAPAGTIDEDVGVDFLSQKNLRSPAVDESDSSRRVAESRRRRSGRNGA